jgi:predicted N-acyltransferase
MARPTLEDRIKSKQEELTELKRQRRGQLRRERSEEEKKSTRRKILIGGAVMKFYPQLHSYDVAGQKYWTEMEKLIEYLSKSTEFMRLLDLAKRETSWPD